MSKNIHIHFHRATVKDATTAELREKGRTLRSAGKFAEAAKAYREAIANYPSSQKTGALGKADIAALEKFATQCEASAKTADASSFTGKGKNGEQAVMKYDPYMKQFFIYVVGKRVGGAPSTARKALAVAKENGITFNEAEVLKAEPQQGLDAKDSVASVEREIAQQQRLIDAAKANGKEAPGTVVQRLKFLKEELAKEKSKTDDAGPSAAEIMSDISTAKEKLATVERTLKSGDFNTTFAAAKNLARIAEGIARDIGTIRADMQKD